MWVSNESDFLFSPQLFGDWEAQLRRIMKLIAGGGLSITGSHNMCGDYLYSGHTVMLTLTYLFIKECKSRATSRENLLTCRSPREQGGIWGGQPLVSRACSQAPREIYVTGACTSWERCLVSLAVSCGIRVFYDCWKEPEGRRQNSRPGWMMVDVVFTWQPFFRHGHCLICSKEVRGGWRCLFPQTGSGLRGAK